LEGDHVFALPYASCLSTFHASGWGIPFSSCSPVAPLRRRSPKTVTTSLWVGRSKPGCDLGPTLSFKDVHHPRWGGGQAEPELYLRAGLWVSLSLSVRGRECSLALREGRTSTTRGWSTAGVVSFSALGSPAWLPEPPPAARAVIAPCAWEDRPRRRALPGRRSCSGAALPLHRYGASARRSVPRLSGRIRVGICRRADGARRRCRGGRDSRSPRRRRDHHHHPSVRASGSLYLSLPLERRRGRGQGCSGVCPEAIAAAVRPPVEGVIVATAGAGDSEPSVGLLLLRRPPNRVGLFVHAEVEPEFRFVMAP
jgi:hypothetical protein